MVADRGNKRLVFYTLEGEFIRHLQNPLFTSPSSIAVRDGDLLITELDGALLAVDTHDEVRSVVPLPAKPHGVGWPNLLENGTLRRPVLALGALTSPHGIAVDAGGSVYLTEWIIGGRQLRITLG